MWVPKAVELGIGMNEFWKSTPKKLERYNVFFLKRREQQEKQLATQGWLHGMYVQLAIGSCLSKSVKYPKTPLGAEQEMESEEIEQPMTDADFFATYAMAFNKKEFGEIE